jgi:hypothetical protein
MQRKYEILVLFLIQIIRIEGINESLFFSFAFLTSNEYSFVWMIVQNHSVFKFETYFVSCLYNRSNLIEFIMI